ncbi:LD-carboxypeptidase [Ginsengibacter hankyongi]|uniref:LD-carboxypeptidase n=1 Tax=Ginsengibacter hankyongi TaxID=2607284 RepID=A0A5J5IK69_9BACT|nr:LD-carboxypeptidase [Ginsengibacter hankyongi]KAA9041410.1 LD-carboxypeptidase [Ginsengibacter hankyongi]
MITIPPYLKPGDTIGILCPSGYMPYEKAVTAIETLTGWGFHIVTGKTLGHQFNYFSGTDEERLNDLQQMMDDDNIKSIFCARGGYGMGRIIDKLSFKKFKRNPKWIIGFSDITVIQSHLFSKYKIASMHAPMAAAFNDGENKNQYIQTLHDSLIGRKADYVSAGNEFNKKGKASGILVGGNLSLLAHLTATSSELKTKNKILFIEDVGEYIYNVDRMMYQLKRSGKLDKLKALIVGRFTEMKDTTIPFGQTVEEVIRDIVKEYDYPVCFNFPVSHDKENYALKIGSEYKLSVSATMAVLKEI